jgi:hypothetical protein
MNRSQMNGTPRLFAASYASLLKNILWPRLGTSFFYLSAQMHWPNRLLRFARTPKDLTGRPFIVPSTRP